VGSPFLIYSRAHPGFYKPRWSETLADLKWASAAAYNLWKVCSCPRNGDFTTEESRAGLQKAQRMDDDFYFSNDLRKLLQGQTWCDSSDTICSYYNLESMYTKTVWKCFWLKFGHLFVTSLNSSAFGINFHVVMHNTPSTQSQTMSLVYPQLMLFCLIK